MKFRCRSKTNSVDRSTGNKGYPLTQQTLRLGVDTRWSRFCQLIVGLGLSIGAGTLQAANPDNVLPHYQPRAIAVPKTAGYLNAEGAVNVVFRREMEKADDPSAKKAELMLSHSAM